MSIHQDETTVITARFRNREDAERCVIELREEGFAADSIDVAFGVAPAPMESLNEEQHEHSIQTEAGAPGTTASIAAEEVLPDTPMTTLTGGSPFGESSTYLPEDARGKPEPGGSTITVRTTRDHAAEARSILHRNNGVAAD